MNYNYNYETSIEILKDRLEHCLNMEKQYKKDLKTFLAIDVVVLLLTLLVDSDTFITMLTSVGVAIHVYLIMKVFDKKRDLYFESVQLQILINFKENNEDEMDEFR